MELREIVRDFAQGLELADAKRPQQSGRGDRMYAPGIGPHHEDTAVRLVLSEMRLLRPGTYESARPIPYPSNPRSKCDLAIGLRPDWAIEIKMARGYGDNGKQDASYLKDLISPYPQDRSALTDSTKLRASGFDKAGTRAAILVYGFDYDDRPLEPTIELLEHLLSRSGPIGTRHQAGFSNLVHPIHVRGRVVAWEVLFDTESS